MAASTPDPPPPFRGALPARLLALAFGFALVALLEGALRVAGLGGVPALLLPLFSPPASPGPARLFEVNPRVAQPFFARPSPGGGRLLGEHRREVVLLPKPTDDLRVLFLGASTVEGFPLPRNLAAARFLETMLQEGLPRRRVEVLNLGVTAVASFAVRSIGERAIAETAPDLVLVYYGHNEFFGASGVASREGLGRSVAVMHLTYALRSTALYQGLASLLRAAFPSRATERPDLIEVMAATSRIRPGGRLHQLASRNLETNLRALVAAARRHGVPIIVATVASNEQGVAPVASWEGDLGDSHLASWRAELAAALEAAQTAPGSAIPRLELLREQAPHHAGATFRLARLVAATGDRKRARALFRRARDLDAMPWRAPSTINQTIRRVARASGTPLADCEASFDRAAGGAPGWRLFFDHVHPTLHGQALLAECLYDALADSGSLPLARRGAAKSWRIVAAALGANPLERFLVLHKMTNLFSSPPLGQSNKAAAERFRRALEEFEARADPVTSEAIRRWRNASAAAGFALPISYFGAVASLRTGHSRSAVAYARAAEGNSYEHSAERNAARVLELLGMIESGTAGEVRQVLARYLEEGAWVDRLPDEPGALQAAAMGRLLLLAARPRQATRQLDLAARVEPRAPAWMRGFLEGLPPVEIVEEVAARLR
jgi:lysophospholipase L1-like esterase